MRPSEGAIVRDEGGFLRLDRAHLARRAVDGRVLAIEQAERVLVVADSLILIDQIEDAIRVGTEVQPEVRVGVASKRPFVSKQAARGIDRLPISSAIARLDRSGLDAEAARLRAPPRATNAGDSSPSICTC